MAVTGWVTIELVNGGAISGLFILLKIEPHITSITAVTQVKATE